jgi:excisionase family DNA binding protein
MIEEETGVRGQVHLSVTDWNRMIKKSKKMYSVAELSELLGYERHTIYKMIKNGKLRGIQSSEKSKWRITEKYVNEFLNGVEDDQISALDDILDGGHL